MNLASRSRSYWVIRVAAALVVSATLYFIDSGPNSRQNTPYWSSFKTWQDRAKPALSQFSVALGQLAFEFADAIKHSQAPEFARLVAGLGTLNVRTRVMRTLSPSPDALLNKKMTTFVTDVSNFEDAFVRSLSTKNPYSMAWVATAIGKLERDNESVLVEWNGQAAKFNSL